MRSLIERLVEERVRFLLGLFWVLWEGRLVGVLFEEAGSERIV